MFKRIGIVLIVLMSFAISTAVAADFPAKDITLIVPWSAGGGTDTISRVLVKNAKKYFGVNVNVVNKTGGMGSIGMGAVATARPDGYTVGMMTFQLSTYRLMGLADLSYKDFGLIQLLNQSSGAVSVSANSKFKTLKDLMEYAKANPNKVTVGHSGAGGSYHLAVSGLAARDNLKFNYVPFDGSAPVRSAVLGGHIDIAASGLDEMLQLYKAKEIRVLAVTGLKRHPLFPDVPTIAEAGFPIKQPVVDWRGLAAPKGISADKMKILVDGFKKCFDDPEFRKLADELGLPLVYKNPADFKEFLAGMEEGLEPTLAAVGLLKK